MDPTLDGYFFSPIILRRIDSSRAEAVAIAHGASREDVSIRASNGVILRGWLFTLKAIRNVLYCSSMQACEIAGTC